MDVPAKGKKKRPGPSKILRPLQKKGGKKEELAKNGEGDKQRVGAKRSSSGGHVPKSRYFKEKRNKDKEGGATTKNRPIQNPRVKNMSPAKNRSQPHTQKDFSRKKKKHKNFKKKTGGSCQDNGGGKRTGEESLP